MEKKAFPTLGLLRQMLLSREGDRRESILLRQGKGWFQVPAAGHEALSVLMYALRPDDYVFPSYRDRPLMLSRGLTPRDLALDFLAKDRSTTGGRNMPAHNSSRRLNIFSPNTPTGSQCLPACGAAWGIAQAKSENVVLCTIGDAATRQGEFYEAVCFAVEKRLPIVFLVEDNGYGISTPTADKLPFRLNIFNEKLVVKVNGRDVFEVFEKGRRAISQARTGLHPVILWAEIDRLSPHTSADDHKVYRTAADIDAMTLRDPIRLYADHLIAGGELTDTGFNAMKEEVALEIDAIYREIIHLPTPSPTTVEDQMFGPPVASLSIPVQPTGENDTIVTAINRTLRAGLETFPEIRLFGEDIQDPKGGVFGFTKGLSKEFPERVVNSPLAEATIVGTAVGLAATGYRPVFEIQFIDFITPAFNQLVTQVSTLRWRTSGEWICPMVLYAPYGAYLPAGGMWHSQSNEGWWAHLPGIRVAIPSTPEDAAGLFWSAMQDNDPSLILIPKHIFRVRMPIVENVPIPFGKAAIRREGKNVTIVAWGNCIELATLAADRLADENISIEIVDLRTIVPCDWEAIRTSLKKTGRLVVVQEDRKTCGFGDAVIREIAGTPETFYLLNAPPRLVASLDTPIPFEPSLEAAVLPSVDQVIAAIRTTLE